MTSEHMAVLVSKVSLMILSQGEKSVMGFWAAGSRVGGCEKMVENLCKFDGIRAEFCGQIVGNR